MIPMTIPLIQNVGLNILQAKNKYKFRVIILILFAFFNVGVSIVLSKLYGGIGAAIGTSISLIGGSIISMNIFYHRKVGINIIEFWKNILKMSVPMLGSIIIAVIVKVYVPIHSISMLLLQIAIYMILYCAFVWKWSMNGYEKELIKKPLQAIQRKLLIKKETL